MTPTVSLPGPDEVVRTIRKAAARGDSKAVEWLRQNGYNVAGLPKRIKPKQS